jgi:hypothetical protein
MSHHHNPWKGFIIGTAGSIVGLLAMEYYWRRIAPLLQPEDETEQNSNPYPADLNLDDISLIGQQYRDEESSTDALGRIFYTRLTGKEPRAKETKTTLSYLVHWLYGMLQGGIYGATQEGSSLSAVPYGLAFATGLWLFGDELVVPLLGLQAGPTAASPAQHANRLGAHLAYGLGTALTAWLLDELTT